MVAGVKFPEAPVTVTVVGPPAVAELVAVRVKVLVLAVLVGLNDAVTPLGKPEAAKLTMPAKPPVGTTVIVLVILLPWATTKVSGVADSVKAGAVVVPTSENFTGVIPVVDAVIVTVPGLFGVV